MMAGLNQTDLNVLKYYADHGMRERYWNYLANPTNERPEADNGYGALAMGVVRNDNMPGAIANNYAQNYVEAHPVNGKRHLTEQQWEQVGVDLIREDYAIREGLYQQGKTEQALNLPGQYVYAAHIAAFEKNGISPNAWTPAVLFNASYERTGNFDEANRIWQDMLDNQTLGTRRALNTIGHQWNNNRLFDGYLKDQVAAYGKAAIDLPYNDPARIGNRYDHYHKEAGRWHHDMLSPVHSEWNPLSQSAVTDTAKIRELDGIYQLRQHRKDQSDPVNKHPDDPNIKITASEHTLANRHEPNQGPQFAQAPRESQLPPLAVNADVMDIIHHAYAASLSKDPKAFDQALNHIGQTDYAQGVRAEARELTQAVEAEQQAMAHQQMPVQQEAEQQVVRGPVMRL